MRLFTLFLPYSLLISGAARAANDRQNEAGIQFFEKEIRPLLEEHCLECHGEKKQKGSLRLDHAMGWKRGGDSGPALSPGHVESSLLWKAVSYEDRDLKMPPKKKLSASELELLRNWISAGAPDPREEKGSLGDEKAKTRADAQFWSFQPPKSYPAPEVKNQAWTVNEVDRFILTKMESAGYEPSPDAETAVLARRLSFDLTGLPPHAQKVSLQDNRTESIRAYAEALMASPAFAERWASHFMDLSRFAESSGGGRSLPFKDAWRFRDYLIESLREAVPVHRMIQEMIAGDLLPAKNAEARRRQLTATGFLVLGPTNYEEQDKGMLRMDIVDEQMETIGRSFMGMTLGCARCHDHKFDPISTQDYYAVAGIFRSTRTLKNYTDNVAHWIDTPLPFDGEKELEYAKFESAAKGLESEISLIKDNLRDAGSSALRKRKAISPADLPGIIVDDSEAQKVGDWKDSNRFPPFIGGGYSHDENQGQGEKTLSFTPKLPIAGQYEVRVAYSGGPGRAEKVAVTVFHADGEDLVYFNQTNEVLKGLQFASLGTWRFEANGQNFVLISNAGAQGYVTVDAVQFLPAAAGMPDMPAAKESAQEKEFKTKLQQLERKLANLQKQFTSRPEAMTVQEDEAPEDAQVHIRGSVRNLGARVPRGFLSAATSPELAATIPPDQSGRLQLAEWLTHPRHPLTARVFVNRVWHWLIGTGIVRTTDNFGSTGEFPSHPELLDSLALRFIAEGWDLRKLITHLITSRTYRQSSDLSTQCAAASAADPDNRLLTRMNRKRLDAECIRDAILVAAGTLDARFGGPNISDAKAVNSNDQKVQNLEYGFKFLDTRRSVYTPAFRNVRHPLFEVFDFSDINQPIGQRTTSTVAPQALFLMNNAQVIENAKMAADAVLQETQASEAKKIIYSAYRRALSREPEEREFELSREFLEVSSSGNATAEERRDGLARLIQTLWATPEFRFLN